MGVDNNLMKYRVQVLFLHKFGDKTSFFQNIYWLLFVSYDTMPWHGQVRCTDSRTHVYLLCIAIAIAQYGRCWFLEAESLFAYVRHNGTSRTNLRLSWLHQPVDDTWDVVRQRHVLFVVGRGLRT